MVETLMYVILVSFLRTCPETKGALAKTSAPSIRARVEFYSRSLPCDG